MLRFIFYYLFANTMFVVSSFDDYSDWWNHFHICPNEHCSPEDLELYGPRQDKNPLCCKLSDVYNDIIIRRLDQVGLLIIEDSPEITEIPRLLSSVRPISLRIIKSGLKILKMNDFTRLTNLEQLNLTYNNIEHLERHIFAPSIEVIDLSNNRISEVSEYAFDNVPKLRILILSNNLIKGISFKSNLINLEIFMIGNNSLSELNENLFQESLALKELCINDNNLNISKLNIDTVLEVFDMSHNPTSIYLISKYFKLKNSNVRVLNIDKMAITIDASENQIDSIVVDAENHLLELNLSKNNYTSIQNLTILKSIQKLDLSFNKIQDFTLTSFSNMTELKELNLENSGLKTIDYGTFSQQKDLSWLDISYNNLKEINFNTLTDKIEYLYIEGNALTNINVFDIHITLPILLELGLSNNNFSCKTLIEIRKQLTALNISMYVPEMVTVSININGIGCEQSNDSMDYQSTKILPIHRHNFTHNSMQETIETRIEKIEKDIVQRNNSFAENSIHSSVNNLLSELKSVQIKLQDLVESVTTLKSPNNTNEENALQLKHSSVDVLKDDDIYSITKGNSSYLISLKNMMIFIIVAIIFLIFGLILTGLYKLRYSAIRRYISTNTVNTTIEQSLV